MNITVERYEPGITLAERDRHLHEHGWAPALGPSRWVKVAFVGSLPGARAFISARSTPAGYEPGVYRVVREDGTEAKERYRVVAGSMTRIHGGGTIL